MRVDCTLVFRGDNDASCSTSTILVLREKVIYQNGILAPSGYQGDYEVNSHDDGLLHA
jgi:hypothetical protein